MTEHVQLKVTGMTCGGCENAITRVLLNTAGVESVVASHQDEKVDVTFDPAQVGVMTVRNLIASLGYSVQP